jgi:hypothetical protein
MGNTRVSRYLERHHPEILAEFKSSSRPHHWRKAVPTCRRNNPGAVESEMDGLQYGDTVLNLAVASGYVSSLIGNPRVRLLLYHHHPEILTEFKAIVAATSLEESVTTPSEEPAILG